MKVRLRSVHEVAKPDVVGWLRPNKDYVVLSIEHLPRKVVSYRIVGRQGIPALFEASLFKITDPRVEEDWVVCYDEEENDLRLVPADWSSPGFWEAFFDGDPDAVARYQEVLQRMVGC